MIGLSIKMLIGGIDFEVKYILRFFNYAKQ